MDGWRERERDSYFVVRRESIHMQTVVHGYRLGRAAVATAYWILFLALYPPTPLLCIIISVRLVTL
jgi:hypothetical protein